MVMKMYEICQLMKKLKLFLEEYVQIYKKMISYDVIESSTATCLLHTTRASLFAVVGDNTNNGNPDIKSVAAKTQMF